MDNDDGSDNIESGGETGDGDKEITDASDSAEEITETAEASEKQGAEELYTEGGKSEELIPSSAGKSAEIMEGGKPAEAHEAAAGKKSSEELITEGDKSAELLAAPSAGKNAELMEGEQSAESYELTAEMKEALTTERDHAYFWSGLGAHGAETAAEIASEKGCTTLELNLEKGGVELPPFDMNQQSREMWRDASREYAARASGDVHVVMGGEVGAESTFMSIEYPALMQNENVSRIIAVHPETGKETVLADRGHPENNLHPVERTVNEGTDEEETLVHFE